MNDKSTLIIFLRFFFYNTAVPFPGHGLPVALETIEVLESEDIRPTLNLQPGGPGYLSLSGTSLKTSPVSVTPAAPRLCRQSFRDYLYSIIK